MNQYVINYFQKQKIHNIGVRPVYNLKMDEKWRLDKTHEHYESHHKFFISLHWIILCSILLTIAIITIFIIKHR